MPSIHENIGAALARVRKVADKNGADIVVSADIDRKDRELLQRTGWLQEIIKGWYMIVRPDVATGDSTSWYTNFWDFARIYLQSRYQDQYCLSAENSLELHVDKPLIPRQIIVIAPHGGGEPISLLYNTSLLIYADPKNIPEQKEVLKGLQVFSLPQALCRMTPKYFQSQPQEVEIALRMVRNTDSMAKFLIKNNLITAANRLIGAYEFIGDQTMAKALHNELTMAGMKLNHVNPFQTEEPLLGKNRDRSPYANRIKALWQSARNQVETFMPNPPGITESPRKYLHEIDLIYEHDAYNSLSIEGYRVTPELILKVKNNHWNPEGNQDDQNIKNALAARGYYEAFNAVKISLNRVFAGELAGEVIESDHQDWYTSLFAPCAHAGIIEKKHLFGYRNNQVFIRNSRHAPPHYNAVGDCMYALFECVQKESHLGVAAVLMHYIFVFIHPYMDGNGRMARFLMNFLLVSGGYHWTVINMKNRSKYMAALGIADESQNFEPLTKLILSEMKNSLEYLQGE